MSTDILLEALTTLTGVKVKPHTEQKAGLALSGWATNAELTTENYLSTVLGTELRAVLSSIDGAENSVTVPEQKELFVNMEEFFDPQFDYDFRSGSDSSRPFRGGESYSRPWGWYRYALKVLDKYPDGNAWLGSDGWRDQSSPGEWPVSFHGTSIRGAEGITSSHYETGSGAVYGRGIYSTPDISEAQQYMKNFTFKENTYRVTMQNRINPDKRIKTKREGYWLIPIADGTSPAKEKEIVEASIRPYGILIKEMKNDSNDCNIV